MTSTIINPIDQIQAHDKVSRHYNFVNTKALIEYCENKGLIVSSTKVARSIKYNGYQKHIVRFRAMGQDLESIGSVPEIVIVNDHKASSSLKVMLGIYRFACENQLVASKSLFFETIMHKGFTYDKLENALTMAVALMPQVLNKIQAMKNKSISYDEACNMALVAMKARGIDTDKMLDYRPAFDQLFKLHRQDDASQDIYTAMNVIQENILKLPLRYRNIEGKNKTTRRVSSLDVDITVNQSLFDEALRLVA